MVSFFKFLIAMSVLSLSMLTVPVMIKFAPVVTPISSSPTSTELKFTENSENISLKNYMKNERINVVSETGTYGILIENGAVTEIKEGGFENPTMIIHCNSTKLNEIINSKNQISKAMDAIIKGELIDVKSNSSLFSIMAEILKTMKSARHVIERIS